MKGERDEKNSWNVKKIQIFRKSIASILNSKFSYRCTISLKNNFLVPGDTYLKIKFNYLWTGQILKSLGYVGSIWRKKMVWNFGDRSKEKQQFKNRLFSKTKACLRKYNDGTKKRKKYFFSLHICGREKWPMSLFSKKRGYNYDSKKTTGHKVS